MKIGIVIAMDKEFARLSALLQGAQTQEVGGREFTCGIIGSHEIVMHQCGIGKVNAAIGATVLVDHFAPEAVISTGVAGGASTKLNVQEVVVASQTCYHDVYCGSEVDYGQVIGSPARFEADATLLKKALALKCGTKITSGLTVTGDWFVDSREKMQSIIDHFPEAMAVDMESGAIAHVCEQRGVAFLSFRIISDIPLSDHKAQQYFDFWDRMADGSFDVTRSLIESL